MSVDLQIGRIVVEGLSPREQQRFGAELEAQLRQLAEDGVLAQSSGRMRRTIPYLNAGVLKQGATAAQAAAQIAQAIARHSASSAPTAQAGSASAPAQAQGGTHV